RPNTRRGGAVKPQVDGVSVSKAGLLTSMVGAPSSGTGASPAAGRPSAPWSNVPRSVPSSDSRWMRPVPRSATKSCCVRGSKAGPPEGAHPLRRRIDGREQGYFAGNAIAPPDRAGTATLLGRPELAGQELRALRAGMDSLDGPALVGNVDRNSVGRGRSEINV